MRYFAADLKAGRYSVAQLMAAGHSATDLKAGGYSAEILWCRAEGCGILYWNPEGCGTLWDTRWLGDALLQKIQFLHLRRVDLKFPKIFRVFSRFYNVE